MDRRRFIRHPVSIPIRCELEGKAAPAATELRDMSYGGLSFRSNEAFSPGDTVLVHYPNLRHPGSVRGTIVWSQEMPVGGHPRFVYGLRFADEGSHFHGRLIEQICHIENYRRSQLRQHGRRLTPAAAAEEWIALQAGRFPL
jgi:hypothetical protein